MQKAEMSQGFFSSDFGFLDQSVISQKRKEPPEIRWWPTDKNFEGFSDFQKTWTYGSGGKIIGILRAFQLDKDIFVYLEA